MNTLDKIKVVAPTWKLNKRVISCANNNTFKLK